MNIKVEFEYCFQRRRSTDEDSELLEEPISKTIELGLYVDEKSYENLNTLAEGDEDIILENILATINQVSAIYKHPSLGHEIDIVVVSLEIFKEQKEELAGHDGNALKLLPAFCR